MLKRNSFFFTFCIANGNAPLILPFSYFLCNNGILNLQRIYNNLDLTVSDYVLYAHFVPKLLIWNQLTPKNKHPLVFFDAYIINSVNKKDNSLREKYKRRCCVTYKLQNV